MAELRWEQAVALSLFLLVLGALLRFGDLRAGSLTQSADPPAGVGDAVQSTGDVSRR